MKTVFSWSNWLMIPVFQKAWQTKACGTAPNRSLGSYSHINGPDETTGHQYDNKSNKKTRRIKQIPAEKSCLKTMGKLRVSFPVFVSFPGKISIREGLLPRHKPGPD
ncbi:MAG: hypothetical protein H7258_14140 [Ferruginibacter sp.]|nr:hypothetical protein [Ferruginibacter sp.]